MSRITETVLYKSNAPFLKGITRRQFAKELAKVKKACRGNRHIMWSEEQIVNAFVWVSTPQGFEFWEKINEDCCNNKRT